MWQEGNNTLHDLEDSIGRLKSLKGYLTEEQARIELYRLLRNNLKWAAHLILGVELFTYQELVLKAMFRKDYPLVICTRGFGKTFLGAVFCCLYPLLEQGTRLAIVAPSFKQSKNLFTQIEKMSQKPGAQIFRSVIGAISHGNDEHFIKIGASEVKAFPLGSGEKIRGFRADVIIIDEYVAMPPSIVQEVIEPFMVVNADPVERQKIYDRETKLIERGKLSEEKRTKFKNPKLIGLTSASYQFEFLYSLYQKYIESILNPNKKTTESYAVLQLSYKTVPSQYLSESVLNKAKTTMSDSQFKREYGAEFTKDSDGYYSMQQMEKCTILAGNPPYMELVGDSKSKYILAIDPCYTESDSSDHFAMCVIKLDEGTQQGYVVHNYAVAGATVKDHSTYFYYLLKHFNIVYIIIDGAGADAFLRFANESPAFKDSKIEVKEFSAEFDDFEKIKEAKKTYNLKENKIIHKQFFQSEWIRAANQELQGNIQHQRIHFCSPIKDENYIGISKTLPIEDLLFDFKDVKYKDNVDKTIELIDMQSKLMQLTKDECSMIEISSSPQGNQTFDLPQNMKREEGRDKPRKDSYTALLLGNWGVKCYFLLQSTEESAFQTFCPFFV